MRRFDAFTSTLLLAGIGHAQAAMLTLHWAHPERTPQTRYVLHWNSLRISGPIDAETPLALLDPATCKQLPGYGDDAPLCAQVPCLPESAYAMALQALDGALASSASNLVTFGTDLNCHRADYGAMVPDHVTTPPPTVAETPVLPVIADPQPTPDTVTRAEVEAQAETQSVMLQQDAGIPEALRQIEAADAALRRPILVEPPAPQPESVSHEVMPQATTPEEILAMYTRSLDHIRERYEQELNRLADAPPRTQRTRGRALLRWARRAQQRAYNWAVRHGHLVEEEGE
jgi:hypothetical protein